MCYGGNKPFTIQLPTPGDTPPGCCQQGGYLQDFTCLLFPRLRIFAPNVRLSIEMLKLGTKLGPFPHQERTTSNSGLNFPLEELNAGKNLAVTTNPEPHVVGLSFLPSYREYHESNQEKLGLCITWYQLHSACGCQQQSFGSWLPMKLQFSPLLVKRNRDHQSYSRGFGSTTAWQNAICLPWEGVGIWSRSTTTSSTAEPWASSSFQW